MAMLQPSTARATANRHEIAEIARVTSVARGSFDPRAAGLYVPCGPGGAIAIGAGAAAPKRRERRCFIASATT